MQPHAKKVRKKSATAAARAKTENSNATNVQESETVNDETDVRSVDSEDEDMKKKIQR